MFSSTLALIVLMAAKKAVAQSTCFALEGNSADGSIIDTYAALGDPFNVGTTNAVFNTTDQTAAGLFTLDTLQTLTTSAGLIGNTDPGLTLDYVFFDTQANANTNGLQPTTCNTDNGTLSCTSQTMSVLQVCDNVLSIGDSVDPSCVGITITPVALPCPASASSTSAPIAAAPSSTDALSSTTSSGATLIAGAPTSTDSSTSTGSGTSTVMTTLVTTALVTSTVFTTQFVTATSGNGTNVYTTAYPLYTTICPPGALPTGLAPASSVPTALPAYAPHAAAYAAGSICPDHLQPNGGNGGNGTSVHGSGAGQQPWYPYTKASTAAGAAATGSFHGSSNSTMKYEGSASSLTIGMGGVFAAVLALLL